MFLQPFKASDWLLPTVLSTTAGAGRCDGISSARRALYCAHYREPGRLPQVARTMPTDPTSVVPVSGAVDQAFARYEFERRGCQSESGKLPDPPILILALALFAITALSL